MLQRIHDGMHAWLQTDRELFEPFLVNIVFSAMLTYFSGFPIRYQNDGKTFFQDKTKVID